MKEDFMEEQKNNNIRLENLFQKKKKTDKI